MTLFLDPEADPETPRLTPASTPADMAATLEYVRLNGATLSAQPNPFRNRTMVSFSVRETQKVVVEVFTVTGERVRLLHEGHTEANVSYQYEFEGNDLAPGVYLTRLTKENGSVVFEKMILMGR